MKRALWIILLVLCIVATVCGIVMTVVAAQFLEYGRVIFYMTIALTALPIGIACIANLNNS